MHFSFGKNVCSAFVYFAFFQEYKSAKSICVVAIGVIHFSVCVASVAHTFLFWRKRMKKPHIKTLFWRLKKFLQKLLYCNKHLKLFVKKMNEKACEIGMRSTFFTQPDGAGLKNKSTTEDLLLSLVAAYRNHTISSVWSNKEKEIICKNTAKRSVLLQSTLYNGGYVSKYKILGGKTGSWAAPSELVSATYNLSVVAEIDGHIVAAVIVNANSSFDRFIAMEELLDIARAALKNEKTNYKTLTCAMCGAVCEILPDTIHSLFSQNLKLQIIPASLAKLVALLVACDYITDYDEVLNFSQCDIREGSGNFFSPGDTITIEDAFYAALLPSSNSAVAALARKVGKKIAKRFK